LRMRSLSLAAGSRVRIESGLELTGRLNLTDGSSVAISGNRSSITVNELDAGAEASVSVEDGGSMLVTGNLTSRGATFSVTVGNLTVEGSVSFDNSTSLSMSDGAGLRVRGNIRFQGLFRFLFAQVVAAANNNNNNNNNRDEGINGEKALNARTIGMATAVPEGTVSLNSGEVIEYGSFDGAFSTVTAVVNLDACQEVVNTQTSYGSSSMSVTVSVAPASSCATDAAGQPAGGGLSTGAIVGIAVGAAVCAIAVMVLIIVVGRRMRIQRTEALFRAREAGRIQSTDARLRAASSVRPD